MTTERSEFKMQFRIEQQPDGTFVGICDQPHLEIKGATHEEVLKKIQDSLGSQIMQKLGLDFGAELTGSGIQVKLNKHVTITRKHADGTVEMMQPTPDGAAEAQAPMPVSAKPIDAGSFLSNELITAMLVLGVIGLLVYWFLFR